MVITRFMIQTVVIHIHSMDHLCAKNKASESVMVNCASSNAASVMFCSLWIVCSASGRIAASISGSASEIAAIVLRQSCLW